jgi:hypothetical protein
MPAAPHARTSYLVGDPAPPGVVGDAVPLGLLPGAEPDVPPAPGLLVPPVAPGASGLAGAAPGVVVVVDDADEPPGTTMASFSFVVADAAGAAGAAGVPAGTTVVVSLRSHAASAKTPAINNR